MSDTQPPAAADNPQWTLEIPLEDLGDTEQLARSLAAYVRAGDLLVLTGGLGAGKTTFTQSLAAALEVEGLVSSPTFVLSRIHRSRSSGPDLVHVDAYRTDVDGLESLDLAATVADSVTVVEWGRGVVEVPLMGAQGSWLDLELTRTDTESEAAPPGDDDARAAVPESAPVFQTDFSETEADALGSQRLAVLRGYGRRWEHAPDVTAEYPGARLSAAKPGPSQQ